MTYLYRLFLKMNNKYILNYISLGFLGILTSAGALAAKNDSVDFSPFPLSGITLNYGANVILDLSIEAPTAGRAYTDIKVFDTQHLSRKFIGYYNNEMCYENINGKHFTPVKPAITKGTQVGLCPGESHYSGNFLNWAIMSGLDIYRQSLTGGNRAYGIGNNDNKPSNYEQGDLINKTYLRSVRVAGGNNGYFGTRYVDLSKEELKNILPHYLSDLPKFAIKRLYFRLNIYADEDDEQSPAILTLPTVVEVCKQGFLESNCVRYGDNYKPEGLMQENAKKMRFAIFGYLDNSDRYSKGGILRGRMKYINQDNTNNINVKTGPEYNPKTGQFYVNPDIEDAKNSNVTNSGVINYVNKAGDTTGYKLFDPTAELYYSSLRYLRHAGDPYTTAKNALQKEKEGFPVITNWEDPLLVNLEEKNSKENICRSNSIVLIGDTFTHQEVSLPGMEAAAGIDLSNAEIPYNDTEINVKNLLIDILQQEGNPFKWNLTVGSSNAPATLAALAYWARVNDIRSGKVFKENKLSGKQIVNTIVIDVVEKNRYKNNQNAYYLAAKYGGFYGSGPWPETRFDWTDDHVGETSIPEFTKGVPRNYSPANQPDLMQEALKKSFNLLETANDPSQTALGTNGINNNGIISSSTGKPFLFFQSTYQNMQGKEWMGDVLAKEMVVQDNGEITFASKWRFSEILWEDFRFKHQNRKVFSSIDKSGVSFAEKNAKLLQPSLGVSNETAPLLINYIRGSDDSEVTNFYRKRTNILGTVVNSTIHTIHPPKANSGVCRFSNWDKASQRGDYMAFAANDGMLHIVNEDGHELMAYIPSSALPKLKDYATNNYEHQFLNDGSPVSSDVCINQEMKSVLIGTTGRGDKSVYALDITDLSNPSEKNILWEFSDQNDDDLGLTTSKVVMSKNSSNQPIAIVSGGYNSESGKGYVFILDVTKPQNTSWQLNKNYWKIPLGVNGVGELLVHENGQGQVAQIYVGDLDGKLWRINHNAQGWHLAYSNQAMFQTDNKRPITSAPTLDKIGNNTYLAFGTGRYFTQSDLPENNPKEQNYAYGLIEKGKEEVVFETTDLLTQSITNNITKNNDLPENQEVLQVSSNNIDNDIHRGWRLELQRGFKIVQQPNIRNKAVVDFLAIGPINKKNVDTCSIEGATSLLSVDVKNGGRYDKSVFLNAPDGSVLTINNTISPEGIWVKTESGRLVFVTVGDNGEIEVIELNRYGQKISLKRLSWRLVIPKFTRSNVHS